MDIEQIVEELREVKATMATVVDKLDTLIFNFNIVHRAQVDQSTELNSLKTQCAQRSLRCPVLTSYPPPTPTPTPATGNGGAP
jgi:uncharacterized coiled-coil DUF342 family protein